MGDDEAKGTGKKVGKWAAIAGAVATPFCMSLFSYLESRDALNATASQGEQTEVIKDRATDAKRGANAGYQIVVREFDRAWDAIDECHERLDDVEAALEEHQVARGLHRRTIRPATSTRRDPPEPMSKSKPARGDLPDDIDMAQEALFD